MRTLTYTTILTVILLDSLRQAACQYRRTHPLNLETRIRPEFSNIKFVKDSHDADVDYYGRRYKRNSFENKIKALKRFNEEHKLRMRNDSDEMFNGYSHNTSLVLNPESPPQYNCDFDEGICNWTWSDDIADQLYVTSGNAVNNSGPKQDFKGNPFGSYLKLSLPSNSNVVEIRSPPLNTSAPSCKLFFHVFQENMKEGNIRVIVDKPSSNETDNHTQWEVELIDGSNDKLWKQMEISLGKITTEFYIILEVVPPENMTDPATVALDNFHFSECFPNNNGTCSSKEYRCNASLKCIGLARICDLQTDCENGDDEQLNCHWMPPGSRCTFEDPNWCGWRNIDPNKGPLRWARHNGSTPTDSTGPNYDHTFKNISGHYVFVNMLSDRSSFASQAVLRSIIFNPPPKVNGNASSQYFNTCMVRFYLHKTGKHKSGISVQVTEITPNENRTTDIYWNFMDDFGDDWYRTELKLPNITNKYYVQFEAKRGYRFMSDIAVDDVSLSPECFGINIPEDDLGGYNYWNPKVDTEEVKKPVEDFKNKTWKSRKNGRRWQHSYKN